MNFTFCSWKTCVFASTREEKYNLTLYKDEWVTNPCFQRTLPNCTFYPRKIRPLKLLLNICKEKRFSWFHSPTVPDLSKDNKRHYLVLLVFCIGPNTSWTPSLFPFLPSDVTDAPEKLPGGKKCLSFEEGKGQQYHGTVVKKAKMRWNDVGDKTDKKEMKIETTKKH